MSNSEDKFLNSLADFKDLKANHHADLSVSHSQTSNVFQQSELNLSSNDKLMKNFKDLREQLKQSNKNCQKLRAKLNERETELEMVKLNEKDNVAQNYQLKNQVQHYKEMVEDYQAKMTYLKDTAKGSIKVHEDLEYLKIEILDYKTKLEKTTTQNKKIIEISVLQKVQLEEKIHKLEAKQQSDLNYVQEMEIQLSKEKEKSFKLQNQLRKASIRYEQQIYQKKWLNGKFQREQLEEQIQQLQRQLQNIQVKYEKEKERRNILEKRVLQLEEISGLWNVKAETYEIQNKNMLKKCKKMERKMSNFKQNAENQTAQSLSWQEKFMKLTSLTEELISRMKREIYGDAVSLAKSCQYKMNKLKEEEKSFKAADRNKSPSISKKRSKSKFLKEQPSPIKFQPQENMSDYQKTKQKFYLLNEENPITFENSKKDSQRFSEKKLSEGSSSTNPLSQIENLDIKIRKERDEMERKIKQKMLYRKIELAEGSDRHKLREEYLNFVEM